MKKRVLFILFISLIAVLGISCSSSKYTMRKLSDVNKAEEAIKKNPTDEKTIAKLLDAVEYGNNSVRAEALWVLGDAQIPQGYEFFLKYANDDPDFNIRQMAVHGIGKMPLMTDEAIDKVRVAMTDTSLPVQIEALEVASILNNEALVPSIVKSLSSSNRWVKMAAIKALKDYESQDINRALTSISDSETDKAIASAADEVIEYRKSIGLI